MSPRSYDALIVGAGPAGCTAAIRLAQAGWSVALIERQPFPRRKVCGECIAASNLPLLAALGVGAAFEALAGPPLRRVGLLVERARIWAALPAARHALQPWGRALSREQLDSLLLERARALGVSVWQPYVAQALDGEPGAYRCALRAAGRRAVPAGTGPLLCAPVAIEARGWHAPAGGPGHCSAAARGRELLAFKANFSGARLPPGVLPVLAFPGGYGGMVLTGAAELTLACCIQRAALQRARRAAPERAAGDAVQAYLQRHCAGVAEALSAAERRGPWLSAGPIRPGQRLASRTARARAPLAPFRIGNAAGEAHPLIGEGISMALQSAWLLTELLCACPQARAHGPAAARAQRLLHARYAARWRRQFLGRLRVAGCFARLAMRPRLARALLPLLRAAPGLLTHGARWSGKIRALRTPRQEIAS